MFWLYINLTLVVDQQYYHKSWWGGGGDMIGQSRLIAQPTPTGFPSIAKKKEILYKALRSRKYFFRLRFRLRLLGAANPNCGSGSSPAPNKFFKTP
jgi:hypothetical protein